MPEFRMPSLGADMEAGTVSEWRVRPGDRVAKGDIVALVETEKASLEVEIFQDGTIEELVVPEGTRVAVGTVLATLKNGKEPAARAAPAAGEAVAARPPAPGPPAPSPARAPAPPPARAPSTAAARAAPGKGAGRPRISPYARSLADELGVDVTAIRGSGPAGAIVEADVRQAAAPPPAAEPIGEPTAETAPVPVAADPAADRDRATRVAIARLMARSKREIPHYYLTTRIDAGRAMAWIAEQNLERRVADRLVPAALLLKAVALAVTEVPEMNGFYADGSFHRSDGVHLGVAISLREGGLIAPAIHDVPSKSLDEVMRCLVDLVARTRSRTLRASEMSDPTLTVTNLGERGVDAVFGVIYPPQVALVGLGRIHEEPWAEGGMVGARPVLTATLAADHRVSDGHRGGLFLAAIGRLLQEPEKL